MGRVFCTGGEAPSGPPSLTLADVDFCVMHSPFVKMVRKGFARIFYQDHLRAQIRQSARQVGLPHWLPSGSSAAFLGGQTHASGSM